MIKWLGGAALYQQPDSCRSRRAPKRNTLRIDVKRNRDHSLYSRILLAVLLVACGEKATAQADEGEVLRAVQRELRAVESRLENQQAMWEIGSHELEVAEREVAAVAVALSSVRAQLAGERSRQQSLAGETSRAIERLNGERDALAQQVRVRFYAGRQEGVKLLLSQETPARLGRMSVYYDYLNHARSNTLDVVELEIATLQNLVAESARVGEKLVLFEQTQANNLSRLETSRELRREVLIGLDAEIKSSADEIHQLSQEAQRLGELFADLGNSRLALPVESAGGISDVVGELAWPVSGTIVNDFGQQRAGGELSWNGVVVGAPGGTPIRAIYHGQVVYADWLPGNGLLVIVDHGGGYMSLYGHNEAILKTSGDWVASGEVIAYVGDSGGQSQTALYFEIRRDGEPIDPHPWMAQGLRKMN